MATQPLSTQRIDMVPDRLEAALQRFAPISLENMGSVSLMRRIDTKYIIHQEQLPEVLGAVENHYAVLEIDHQRAMRYASQYFDTTSYRFFNDHHNKRAKRIKVRIRSYVDSGVSFLEVKQKTVKGVTNKTRTRFTAENMELSPDALRFIEDAIVERTIDSEDLQPTIRNRFRRITLVDTERSERVTLDWNLSSHMAPVDCPHQNLVIVEVKQEGLDRHAPIMQVLKSVGARPYRISKYCLGMSCLYPSLKANRFKKKLLRVKKVTSQSRH